MANNNNDLTVQPKKRGRKQKSLSNSKNCASNKNGILKYFNERGKQNDDAHDSNAPKENEDLRDSQASKKLERTKSNTIKTIDMPVEDNLNKIPTSNKKKSDRPLSSKQRVIKLNLARNLLCKSKYTTLRKLTKEDIKNSSTRKIPKEHLNNVLELIDNDDHPIWEDNNISCNQSIHRFWEPTTLISNQNLKLKLARQFLLRRDWNSLSKILCLSSLESKIYYPLLSKVIISLSNAVYGAPKI